MRINIHSKNKARQNHPVPSKPAESDSKSRGGHHEQHAMMVEDFRKRLWISLLFTIPVLILSPAIQKFLGLRETITFAGDLYVLFVLSSVVFFYGGYPFLSGFLSELRKKQPGMMTLVAIAITTAYLYSLAVIFGLAGKVFFWELVTLVDIMLLGHWIEMKSVMGASRALQDLVALMPSEAHLLQPDGTTKDIFLDQLKVGDLVLVKPGEKIPADGEVTEGETSINEAMLTGESKPVEKKKGSPVIGGAINSEGSVTVEIKKAGKDSFLAQVIELVRHAQEGKSKTQGLADRVALWLTLVAIGCGILTVFVWMVIIDKNFAFAIERGVTVMVITCPHALGLAIPLVVAVSTSLAAQNGLLIRNRTAFEAARNIGAIIFDKTGTLTEGKFGVTDIITFSNDIDQNEILQYAASLEANSEHSIAKGICAAYSKKLYRVDNFRALPGKGTEGQAGGKNVLVVSPGYLKEHNIAVTDKRLTQFFSQGKTVVFVMLDGKLKGALALADIIRPESKSAIAGLKQMGIKCIMLTGDNRQAAEWVAGNLGLDDYFAEVLPDKKSEKVIEIQSSGLTTAMVGDGINDAPALAQADVGIAIGAGTDVAVETADIILVKSNPQDVVVILSLARATYNKMMQNLVWATGYNVIAIPLAAGVLYNAQILLSPAMGAVLMSLSTVIVAINARFLKIQGK